MRASNLIGAVLSVAMVIGGGIAVARSGDKALADANNARDAICHSALLSIADQSECASKMKAAQSAISKQEVAIRYQSKADRANS